MSIHRILRVRFGLLFTTSVIIILISILLKLKFWNKSKIPDYDRIDFRFEGTANDLPFLMIPHPALGKVFIRRRLNQSFEEAAVILSAGRAVDIYQPDLIDICNTDDPKECHEMDIRIFIHQYFEELMRQPRNQSVLGAEEFTRYSLSEDSKGILNSESSEMTTSMALAKFRALGMMLAMAVGTLSYLDIKFQPGFFASFDSHVDIPSLLNSSSRSDQFYIILFLIKRRDKMESFDFYLNTKDPFTYPFLKPNRPIEHLEYKGDLKNLYVMGAKQIFHQPYRASYALMAEGFKKIFPNDNPTQYKDFRLIDLAMEASCFRYEYWKIRSDCGKKCQKFWRAFSRLNLRAQLKIYKLCTGYSRIPKGFEFRLPMTHFYLGDGKMFPDLFKVVINPNRSEDDFYNEFLEISNN